MSNSHQKILFCIADFILSLLKAARILLLWRMYMFFYLQSHFGLVFRLLQGDFASSNYWALPKDRTELWSVFASIRVVIFNSSPRKLVHSANIFWKLPLLLSLCYSCQLHWQMLFEDIWDWKQEVLSPHKSLFVLICILSCLTIDSAVSLLFFSLFCKNFFCSPVLCRSAATVPLLQHCLIPDLLTPTRPLDFCSTPDCRSCKQATRLDLACLIFFQELNFAFMKNEQQMFDWSFSSSFIPLNFRNFSVASTVASTSTSKVSLQFLHRCYAVCFDDSY